VETHGCFVHIVMREILVCFYENSENSSNSCGLVRLNCFPGNPKEKHIKAINVFIQHKMPAAIMVS
jgi:hypothetical protein